MPDFIGARDYLLKGLREELVGPCARGELIDCSGPIEFDGFSNAQGPFRQKHNSEEILVGDRPARRYGIGVLYPVGTATGSSSSMSVGEEAELEATATEDGASSRDVKVTQLGSGSATDDEDAGDTNLSLASGFRPSTVGVSFLVDLSSGEDLVVRLTGGRYSPFDVTVKRESGDAVRTWWLRTPLEVAARFSAASLLGTDGAVRPHGVMASELPKGWSLDIGAVSRPWGNDKSLVTITAVNRSSTFGSVDGFTLFQTSLTAEVGEGMPAICPYEERRLVPEEAELKSLEMLYRDKRAFAIGHGCSADWDPSDVTARAVRVMSESLPSVQLPSTTPEIIDHKTKLPISVSMKELADRSDKGQRSLSALVDSYGTWIADKEREIPLIEEVHHDTARAHLELARESHARMIDGIQFLKEDEIAAEAFSLANRAMMNQQGRSDHAPRTTSFDQSQLRIKVDGDAPTVNNAASWFPFQIAFALTALRSTAKGDDTERRTVELIFFPTGGGKTEAYLALAAFSIFYRRLSNPQDVGVDVLMRYTLRLLTAQQFQRAAALICAMDELRQQDMSRLGVDEISVGVWLGGGATPNRKSDAVEALRKLDRGDKYADNPFILLKCPWCAAQMGPIATSGKKSKVRVPNVAGYQKQNGGVTFHCPDRSCKFHERLPVYVDDDDVYEHRPTLVIGTVDKFAMLAFRPKARALFGLSENGSRDFSPPNLIIQDELHLISGPLGSMVGIYEVLIEALCSQGYAEVPKIVGSTATIRRAEEQIHHLYGRSKSVLFPARGLDADDSFFASSAKDKDENLLPGRVYVGVHGTGLGSIQTAQVRTFASLLQSAGCLPDDQRDPWWTLLSFFNSLRELGTSLSLIQSDIPDYLKVLRKRLGLSFEQSRRPWNVLELTGRLKNDEVPKAIEELQRGVGGKRGATDICLASNIVEVGVDVPRLSLMAVVGQPKTTSQYIQATGRIGRNWRERPGLVATIYSASKPRDRSHFEQFRAYHERLYAQVEPTSVTPFAPPVLDRALHAVIVAYVRQFAQIDAGPDPVPHALIEAAHDLLAARVEDVDPTEIVNFESVFAKRVAEWNRWTRIDWQKRRDSEEIPLLRFAGEYADAAEKRVSWAIPTSLRNVDAECQAAVTQSYVANVESDDV